MELGFCRHLKEGEIFDVAHLTNMISTYKYGNEGPDQRVWSNGRHAFSVADCYKAMEADGLLHFPYKALWNPKIP